MSCNKEAKKHAKFVFSFLFNVALLILLAFAGSWFVNENGDYDDDVQQRGLILMIISAVLLLLYNASVWWLTPKPSDKTLCNALVWWLTPKPSDETQTLNYPYNTI